MSSIDVVRESFDEHMKVISDSYLTMRDLIPKAGKILSKCLDDGGTVFWCGNGGSAADSQHLAAELVGRFKNNRRALRSIALTTDSSVITCVANDYSYDDIFARQIDSLGREGDVLVCISTSGKSENILRAIGQAHKLGITTIAFLGKKGGLASELASLSVIVPSDVTARIQETHILIGHILCELIEGNLNIA